MLSTGRTALADLSGQAITSMGMIDGSRANPPLHFIKKRSTGMYRRSSDGAIVFAVNGVDRFSIKSGSTGDEGTLHIDDTTDSTSTTTGALTIAGGLGVAKTLYANTIYESTRRVVSNYAGHTSSMEIGNANTNGAGSNSVAVVPSGQTYYITTLGQSVLIGMGTKPSAGDRCVHIGHSVSNNEYNHHSVMVGHGVCGYDGGTSLANYCTYVGFQVLGKTSGDPYYTTYNTCVGHKAYFSATTASDTGYNSMLGANSGYSMTTGSKNTLVGANAGSNATTGNFNTALGYDAMKTGITTGTYNVCLGVLSGDALTSGRCNILIGRTAGNTLTTGSENVVIGDNADVSAVGDGNSIIIGNGAFGTSNVVHIGSVAGTNITGTGNVLLGYQSGSNASSQTYSNAVCLGNQAGLGQNFNEKLIIANSSTAADNLIEGVFSSTQNTREVYLNAHLKKSLTAGITASVTQTQGQGALTTDLNQVSTCATANDTVTLPSAVAGYECTVMNSGVSNLQIFPASGDDLGAGVNTAISIPPSTYKTFTSYDTTNWVGFSTCGPITPLLTSISNTDSPYTVLATDDIIVVDCSGGVVTVNLPAVTATPKRLEIKDATGNSGANNITVNRNGSDTIDGGTSSTLSTNYASLTLCSDGSSQWMIL